MSENREIGLIELTKVHVELIEGLLNRIMELEIKVEQMNNLLANVEART